MSEARFVVVHGHFYQPPRENPWTEEVAREPSAAPFHDWNARITAECYRPNGAARIVDEQNRVVAIVDNYDHLSYNMGPTLLSWLERSARDVYEHVTRWRPGAMAQAYGHVILPLCNERDLRTQIRWGLADFAHRFGQPAKGMWLPECAVNDVVLAALADEGVEHIILAPGQAAEPVDVRYPHRWADDEGRSIDVLFYDGGLSHALAFELPTLSSEGFVDRISAGLGPGGVVTVATDGESFGHHHHFGERLLAHALTDEAPRRGLQVSHPAAVLDRVSERRPVKVAESSWSCVHGVARWKEDCGCSTGGQPGWNQRWRAPLRVALDGLRDRAAEIFERRGAAALRDPWLARDEYIAVILGARSIDDFLADHLKGEDRVEALTLLESQRMAMAMFTSCGWFFNDLAGLETVQVLRYAARVVDHLKDLGEDGGEHELIAALTRAESNLVDEGDGAKVWARHVEPARVDPDRVTAHIALLELLSDEPVPARIAAHDIEMIQHDHRYHGGLSLCTGTIEMTHVRTTARTRRTYAALRLGGLDVMGVCRPSAEGDAVELAGLAEALSAGEPATAIIRRMSGMGREFDLSWALPDAADAIMEGTGSRQGRLASGPVLVVVTGYPASGKTSVGEDLARRLGLAFFNKDGVKEILFDVLGVGDRAWSHRLGRAAIAVLLHQAERSLAAGVGAVVEANFDQERGSRELGELIKSCGARAVQVVVTASPDELVRRYRDRIESGERHPGHLDAALADELESMVAQPYPPLDLACPAVTFDTGSDPNFEELVVQVRASL